MKKIFTIKRDNLLKREFNKVDKQEIGKAPENRDTEVLLNALKKIAA